MTNNWLLQIAKRELRRGRSDADVNEVIRLADALQIDLLPDRTVTEDILMEAKRINALENRVARKYALDHLYQYRHVDHAQLLDAVASELSKQYPTWGIVSVRALVELADEQLQLAFQTRPIQKAIWNDATKCGQCFVQASDGLFLNLTTFEVGPCCWHCANRQIPKEAVAK